MILRLLFMLILALLCAVLTKGQPSGSIQQLEETKKQLHLTFDPIELVNKTHEQRWPLLGGYYMDFQAYKKDSVVAYSILQRILMKTCNGRFTICRATSGRTALVLPMKKRRNRPFPIGKHMLPLARIGKNF